MKFEVGDFVVVVKTFNDQQVKVGQKGVVIALKNNDPVVDFEGREYPLLMVWGGIQKIQNKNAR